MWPLDEFNCWSVADTLNEPIFFEVIYVPNIANMTSNKPTAGDGK